MSDVEALKNIIVKFIERHQAHADIHVALDVVPDVIRFDCDLPDCRENLQIKYNWRVGETS